jgi:phosphoglycolate phosphatase
MRSNLTIGFDLDGTLIDSSRSISSALTKAISSVIGSQYRLESFLVGAPLDELINKLDFGKRKAHDIKCEFKRLYDADFCFQAELYPGIFEAIQVLVDKHDLYVVTNKREVVAKKILDHLGLSKYFLEIIGQGEASAYSKTAMLLRAKDDLEFEKGFYIGDITDDMLAAKAAHLTPIYCEWGYGSSSPPLSVQSIKSPSDLFAIADLRC